MRGGTELQEGRPGARVDRWKRSEKERSDKVVPGSASETGDGAEL